jgi:hypothetical protein
MNTNFSISRFGLVFKAHMAEKGGSFLTGFGLILGIMLFLMIPIIFSRQYSEILMLMQPLALFGVVFLGVSLMVSTAFGAYGQPATGIQAIMLPASKIEKYLVILLMNLLLSVAAFLIFQYLHYYLVGIANSNLVDGRKYTPIPDEILTLFIFSYLLLLGFMFLGSIYFSRNAFLKTLVVGFLILILGIWLHYSLGYWFTGNPEQMVSFPYTSWTVWFSQRYVIEYPDGVELLIKIYLTLIVAVLTWTAYVRLKEKEI